MTEIVFVTGASAGLGAAIAKRFATRGARLVLAARRIDRLRVLADRLGAPAHVIELDVRDRAAVFRAVDELPPDFREVSILVNNAGAALGLEKAHDADVDDWDEMIDA